MSRVDALLEQRLKKSSSSKMNELALKSVQGNLSSFAGVFSVSSLPDHEKKSLKDLLEEFIINKERLSDDLENLSLLTSEVKAISNQAALLHGERIKKAQLILKNYRDGAFTAWLVSAYGNRQTPYNFLMYFELHAHLSPELRARYETMPRQAAYTLASRKAPWNEKQKIVEKYHGQSKRLLIQEIRLTFPIDTKDRRSTKKEAKIVSLLKEVRSNLQDLNGVDLKKNDKFAILQLLEECKNIFTNL